MNFFKSKYLYLILASLLGSTGLYSCVDDDIQANGEIGSPVPTEGYYLTFKTTLAAMSADEPSSDFEKYENYVNPDKVYLLFFYNEGKILGDGPEVDDNYKNTLIKKFKPGDFQLVPVNDEGSFMSQEWYVQIPINDENFAKTLRDNNFKIAVLANWNSTIDDLKEEKVSTSSPEPGDHISILHHMSTPSGQGSDDMINKDAFEFLQEGKATLGSYSNWVKDGLSEEDAEKFIREYYGPGINENIDNNPYDLNNSKDQYGKNKYGNLWLLWNFSAAAAGYYEGGGESGSVKAGEKFFDSDNKFKEEWASKIQVSYELINKTESDVKTNRKHISQWLNTKDPSAQNYILTSFGPVVNNPSNFQFISEAVEENKKIEGFEASTRYSNTLTVDGTPLEYVGINLKKGNKDNNVIRFKMLNNGKLRIKYGSTDGQPTDIKIEARNHDDDNDANGTIASGVKLVTSNKDGYDTFNYEDPTSSSQNKEIKITGDPEYLYIYSDTKSNGVIYEIEYISSYYLHNFDNSGRILSETQTIPMYGVQNFDKISDWKPGTVFDLSNYNHLTDVVYDNPRYTCKTISLIRSVAKVELKIPKTLRPHHVYLRCQNRKARSEPMDVITPTDVLWYDDEKKHPEDCDDWEKIYGHTPFFESSGSKDLDRYKGKLAWYYGTWADVNGYVGSDDEKVLITERNKPYPHIMNAMIGRTDFTEFNEIGSDSYYHRYVLYVPEKYVDDPGTAGNETSTPKICHIEFRGTNDTYDNVDDNMCYRVYFTDNGFYDNEGQIKYPTFGKIPEYEADGKTEKKDPETGEFIYTSETSTWESIYENDPEILRHHWPIIRNHTYSFTVLDTDKRMVMVKLEVLPWREIIDNSYSW